MLGMDRPQLIGRALGGFISDQDQSQYYAYREKLANHLFVSAIQVQMVRADGSTLHVQLESLVSEAPPEGDDPAPISFRTTLTDVSNEMAGKVALQDANLRLETILSQLKSSQEERSKIEKFAVVGQMAAGIAHEFNNMLASILLFTQLSQRSIMGATVEKQTKIQGYLAQAETEILRAAKMVQSILDFGQKAILDKGALDLAMFLDDLIHSFRNTLPSTIDCTFSAQEEDAVVWADEGRLRQAIANLTTNAQLAMPDGGEIHFSLTHLAVAHPANAPMPGMKAGQWALVTVTDTGIGMSEKTLAHLFEPFFTTRAPLGSGLGLAQVYGIITQHKGHIHIDSQLGRGTTVTLYLPLADPDQSDGG
jgi:signal transduction histidine kinase